jgi:putative endonuclease
VRRVYEHKHNLIPGFTQKHSVHKLVYFEVHQDVKEAITREKQIKKWKRQWKLNLIDEHNPAWKDLYVNISPDNGLLPSHTSKLSVYEE